MKFSTKENAKVVKDFQNHVLKVSYFKLIVPMISIFAVGIIFFATSNPTLGIFFTTFSIVFMLILPLVQILANNRLNKSSKYMMEDKAVEYEIDENNISLSVFKSEVIIASSKYEYTQIYKVEENKNYFYIYIANNQALPISKSDLSEEAINELRSILQHNCHRYKVF